MTAIQHFEDLEAWQSARKLTKRIYRASGQGAFAKDFPLQDQIRRAAISVMSGIAEGFESNTNELFVDRLGRAKASAGEVRSQLYIAYDQGYLRENEFDELKNNTEEVTRQITGLVDHIESIIKPKAGDKTLEFKVEE
jgi:four helix bundle protein